MFRIYILVRSTNGHKLDLFSSTSIILQSINSTLSQNSLRPEDCTRKQFNNNNAVIVKLLVKRYKICQMVFQANKHLKNYLLIYHLIFMPNISFLGHQLFFYKHFWEVKGGFALFACCSILEMLLVSLNTAKVCFEAHRPLHTIQGISLRILSHETRFQVLIILFFFNNFHKI